MFPLRQSFTNVAFFARRIPMVLRRRFVGSEYLRSHPEIPTELEPPHVEAIVDQLVALAPELPIVSFPIDRNAFTQWKRNAAYPLLAYHSAREEKYLEHFVSRELLHPITSGDLIDVASCRSYFPAIMRRYGFRVIEQDLDYAPGLHGNQLGGNAAEMHLPSESVDALTLHCSFEHFEGQTDTRFVHEAHRVLRLQGRVVILPLYLHHKYLTLVDPSELAASGVTVDAGSSIVAYPGYGNRHGRIYNPRAFLERVCKPAWQAGFQVVVHRVENAAAISPHCYLRFALVLHKSA